MKDAMAARGASRFFSGRRCPPFLGPRSHGGRDVLTARTSDAKIKAACNMEEQNELQLISGIITVK